MTHLPARSAAPGMPPTATGCPGFSPPCRSGGADTCMSAPITGPRPNADKLQLLIRRELLIADLREARRAHRATSSLAAELRRVTHQTLSR